MSPNKNELHDTSITIQPIWMPSQLGASHSRISDFENFVSSRYGITCSSYQDLWNWSVAHIEDFWSAVWEFFNVKAHSPYHSVLNGKSMKESQWFAGATLNYAEHALRNGDKNSPAIISVKEDKTTNVTTWNELYREVGALQNWLTSVGVVRGDRVVGYLPHGRHAIVAMLASVGLGAVWSGCGQDLAPHGAAARFKQLDPVVLIVGDGYCWNGVEQDRRSQGEELASMLPTLKSVISVSHVGLEYNVNNFTNWQTATDKPFPPVFVEMAFDDPLWVLFSSGTTGPPKGIVHGHGGALLEHFKMLGLHFDLSENSCFFWHTTTNWMMWNVVASGLLTGSTIVLYDGSPTWPHAGRLFEIASEHRAELLGVSPGYLLQCERAGLDPQHEYDMGDLRMLASTGSPLAAFSYRWVRDHVGENVQLNSTSGGTDIVSAFAGSAPNTPIWPGEVSAAHLGVSLESWSPEGITLVDEVGELVITKPMPSMPLYFWGDEDGSRYFDAYYSTYPGIWRHGDWITKTSRGSITFYGRSDSTLNRHGVRIGSSEIYDVVEGLPEIHEALVIGAELLDGSYWMPLFIVLEPEYQLDDETRQRIINEIRTNTSPRHVPDEIIEVTAIPHTRTGKKLEIPVKRLIQGAAIESTVNVDAVDDFASLEYFKKFSRDSKKAEGHSF